MDDKEYNWNLESEVTSEQLSAFKELKETLGHDLLKNTSDQKVLKFLIAREYDVSRAADMLKRHLQYWNKLQIPELLDQYANNVKAKYFSTAILGYDNDGCIVRLLRVGVSDIKGLALSFTKTEALFFAANLLETDKKAQRERFKKTGKGGHDKQTYIIDLQELRWRLIFCRPLTQLFTLMLRLYEGNYPESLNSAYIVNIPGFFGVIYKFVKNILPSEILNKVQILSTEEYANTLTSIMAPELLPKSLGGTRTDEDGNEYCLSLFCYPPHTPVPEEYYLKSTLEKDPEAKKVTVAAQDSFSVKFEITSPPGFLMWDFQTQYNDIGLGLLYYSEEHNEPTWVLPSKRYDCHKFLESGRYTCRRVGTYELIFDNTFSWWSSKELTYKVLLSSEEATQDLPE